MPLVRNIRNEWGRQGGENPQRSDLWQVDLTGVVNGINIALDAGFRIIPRWWTASVALPEPKIKAEVTRRDSRNYQMPSWDEPFDPVAISFIVDDGGYQRGKNASTVPKTEIYAILDAWRRLVRAGRGAVGNEPAVLPLDEDYQRTFRFSVWLYLLRGLAPVTSLATGNARTPATAAQADAQAMMNANAEEFVTRQQSLATTEFQASMSTDMAVSSTYVLEDAWISGFKLGELRYSGSTFLTLNATLQVANVLQDVSSVPHPL